MKNRYVAYDSSNGEYNEFETLQEAIDWLKEGDSEGISDEACDGQNWIAEIKYKSEVTEIDNRSNYEYDEEECMWINKDGEEWNYGNDFEWIGDHHYVEIDWENEVLTAK